ncbi:Rrf2 family transcriptional regulator [Domibacillus sp. A3M-37]|uniref:RrF2 family transcriptional regulator n=1 Tax=Domibacillus TaxID=1433999 RepID=UPI000617FED4|nr:MULTISPECIES: Rrf2 family transcriptional regulator [Domibacillus]MCP3762143.1 Rrf2 family transcriptional regulator [Domibacillus sp. A3M-37]
MKLTLYTDYSLRMLVFLGAKEEGELSNIREIADAYNISKNHLMKVTHELGKLGYIETIRGRNGGIRLAKNPLDINIGEVVRKTEDDFHLVECFVDPGRCVITPICGLRHVFAEALQAFMSVLDRYTLNDFLADKDMLRIFLESDASIT